MRKPQAGQHVQFDIETARRTCRLVLPLELVILMARDYIIAGALQEEAEIAEYVALNAPQTRLQPRGGIDAALDYSPAGVLEAL